MNKFKSGFSSAIQASPFAKKFKSADEEYREAYASMIEMEKALNIVLKDLHLWQVGVQDMLTRQRIVPEHMLKNTKEGTMLHTILTNSVATAEQMINEKKTKLDVDIKSKFVDPVQAYLNVYHEMQDRHKERNRREELMHKYTKSIAKLKEKNDPRLLAEQQRLDAIIPGVEELTLEMKNDIIRLLEETDAFLIPLFGQLVATQNNFTHCLTIQTTAMVGSIDQAYTVVPEFRYMITPRPQSSMTKSYGVKGVDLYEGNGPPPASTYIPTLDRSNPYATNMEGNTHTSPVPDPYANPYGQPTGLTPPAPSPYLAVPPPPPVAVPPPPAYRQARGGWAFTATNPTELSFNAGDILIIHESNGDWWTAELNGARGLIPGNYVTMI